MTNEMIHTWLGGAGEAPDYLADDGVACRTLPVLVERGYYCELASGSTPSGKVWIFDIGRAGLRDFEYSFDNDPNCFHGMESTISAAITSAVINMLEKEGV